MTIEQLTQNTLEQPLEFLELFSPHDINFLSNGYYFLDSESPYNYLSLFLPLSTKLEPFATRGLWSAALNAGWQTYGSRDKENTARWQDSTGTTIDFGFNSYGLNLSLGTRVDSEVNLLEVAQDIISNPSWIQSEYDLYTQNKLSSISRRSLESDYIASIHFQKLVYGLEDTQCDIVTPEIIEQWDPETAQSMLARWAVELKPIFTSAYVNDSQVLADYEPVIKNEWRQPASYVPYLKLPHWSPGLHKLTNPNKEEQSYLLFVLPGPDFNQEGDTMAMSFIRHVLAGYFNARLYRSWRQEMGATYGVRSRVEQQGIFSFFTIASNIKTGSIADCLQDLQRQLTDLQTKLIAPEEMEFLKRTVQGSILLSYNSKLDHYLKFNHYLKQRKDMDYPRRYWDWLQQLQPEQIQQAAQKYLNYEQAVIIQVGE